MNNKENWYLVDDLAEEGVAFASNLSLTGEVQIEYLTPPQARELLLSGSCNPLGILLDVDLTAQAGELGTGPGIAQDLRVKQKAGLVPEFPIVRFAAEPKVRNLIWGDPSSDDLFDLKIQKHEMKNPQWIVQRLLAIREIYEQLIQYDSLPMLIPNILGSDENTLSRWAHPAFLDRIASAISPHVAANSFIRSFILPTGLLIDEKVLSYRLGIDIESSGSSWAELVNTFSFNYKGAGGGHFKRWWARGLEDWWYATISNRNALISLTSAQRVEALSTKLNIEGIKSLTLPEGSPGEKPWRACALNLEESGAYVPIDADNGVKVTLGVDMPTWVDPLFASLKSAVQNSADRRISKKDIERLKRKFS
ncbi:MULTISPECIES: hypothetical protein [unclassified Pseudomonas]|uniref:hypothetical protein n=1 Tax=unclassified Pseudomonas TaxID=196821 RepID=UPI0011AF72B4|nr:MULTISPECIES: hypothetical protein [unclassified Pseudomonas]